MKYAKPDDVSRAPSNAHASDAAAMPSMRTCPSSAAREP